MTSVDLAVAPNPEPVTVTRWRCPFCRRSRAHKSATAEHIARCWLNPAIRSCKTCANLEPGHDACGCELGCNWGSLYGAVPDSCAAGFELGGTIKTACPLWQLREEAA